MKRRKQRRKRRRKGKSGWGEQNSRVLHQYETLLSCYSMYQCMCGFCEAIIGYKNVSQKFVMHYT